MWLLRMLKRYIMQPYCEPFADCFVVQQHSLSVVVKLHQLWLDEFKKLCHCCSFSPDNYPHCWQQSHFQRSLRLNKWIAFDWETLMRATCLLVHLLQLFLFIYFCVVTCEEVSVRKSILQQQLLLLRFLPWRVVRVRFTVRIFLSRIPAGGSHFQFLSGGEGGFFENEFSQ